MGRRFSSSEPAQILRYSLVSTSTEIFANSREISVKARENSRGAHFRADFPAPGELASSRFTVARRTSGTLDITSEPVRFIHVRPGETLLTGTAAE